MRKRLVKGSREAKAYMAKLRKLAAAKRLTKARSWKQRVGKIGAARRRLHRAQSAQLRSWGVPKRNPADYQSVLTAAQRVGYSMQDAVKIASVFKRTGQMPATVEAQLRYFAANPVNVRTTSRGVQGRFNLVDSVEMVAHGSTPRLRVSRGGRKDFAWVDATRNPRGRFARPAEDNPRATEVADAFARGETHAVASNFYVHGNRIYSYGPHFPIAERRGDQFIFTTRRSPSVTTSKHMTYVRRALSAAGITPIMMDLEPDGGGPPGYSPLRDDPRYLDPQDPRARGPRSGYRNPRRTRRNAGFTITTKYVGPTNSRGSRIIATASSGERMSVPYQHQLSGEAVHRYAADQLAKKLGWGGRLVAGDAKNGYVFVALAIHEGDLPESNRARRNFPMPNPRSSEKSHGFYVMGRYTSASWWPTKAEAEAEAKRLNYRGGSVYYVEQANGAACNPACNNPRHQHALVWQRAPGVTDVIKTFDRRAQAERGARTLRRRGGKAGVATLRNNPLLQMVTLAGMNPGKMSKFSLTSTPAIYTPGIMEYARHGYRTSKGIEKSKFINILVRGYSLPKNVAEGLLDGSIPYEVRGENVVFATVSWKKNPVIRPSSSLSGIGRARRNFPMSNPGNPPFKNGQKIPVEKAWAWVQRTGNKQLIAQFKKAWELQKKANKNPKHVIWRTVDIGDPNKIEMVTAMAHYGDSPDTYYVPPKGSKKGSSTLYRHKWGEGGKGKKSVPLLAAASGKALLMPLDGKKVAGDWLRH